MRGRGPSASSNPTWPPPPEAIHGHLGRTRTPLHARRPIAGPGAIGGRGIHGSCPRVRALWLCAARRRQRLNATTRCRWAETAECDGTLESMSRNSCPAFSKRTCANCLILSCVLLDQMSPFDRDALYPTVGLGDAAMRRERVCCGALSHVAPPRGLNADRVMIRSARWRSGRSENEKIAKNVGLLRFDLAIGE
jgi:hypothetical protein